MWGGGSGAAKGREEEECQGGRSQNAQRVAIDGASVRAACLPRGRSGLLRDLVFGFLFLSVGDVEASVAEV